MLPEESLLLVPLPLIILAYEFHGPVGATEPMVVLVLRLGSSTGPGNSESRVVSIWCETEPSLFPLSPDCRSKTQLGFLTVSTVYLLQCQAHDPIEAGKKPLEQSLCRICKSDRRLVDGVPDRAVNSSDPAVATFIPT